MTNSRATGGGLVILDKYTAGSAESSYTFTKTLTNSAYSKIIVIIDGEATASLALECVINASEGTTNHNHGMRLTGAAIAHIQNNSTAQIELLSATVIAGAYGFSGTLEIYQSSADDFQTNSFFNSGIAGMLEHMSAFCSASAPITSIKIQTSTSTWKTGTHISIYGVKR